MKKLYSLLVLTFVFIAAVSADEYVVSSWEKSKLSGETAVSADKLLIGDKPIDVMQPLRLNPYDSLVVINTTTNRASIYVNCSDKVKILKVNDIVKRRSLNVFITMLSETFAPRKEEPQQYKLLGTTSRQEITQNDVDPEHMKIYATLLDYMAKDKTKGLPKHKDLRFYTDTVNGIVTFAVENYNRKKSYIVNVLVYDPLTRRMNLALSFPDYTSSPMVMVGPYSRITLDGVGYAVRDRAPLKFYLVASRKPYDPNYLAALMQAENIKPVREGKNKDIVCVPVEK